MVELATAQEGDAVLARWLREMRRQHAYWMRGAETLKPGQAAARRWLAAQSLLGRRGHPTSRVVHAGRRHREAVTGSPAGRGLARPARRRRERLGLQLALVRRRPDAGDDPYHRHRADRPERVDGRTRTRDRQGLRASGRPGLRRAVRRGGLATTTLRTGQQWDAPNGWAPLQWIADQAARRYGRPALAQAIDARFLASVDKVYASELKLVEKYVVDGSGGAGGGGEYPRQDGFGWSNGVALKMMAQREQDRAKPATADALTRCAN